MVRTDGKPAWLLDQLGQHFTLLYCGTELAHGLPGSMRLVRIGHDVTDAEGLFQQRYDAQPGSAWLVRPDQHLAARFRRLDHRALAAATRRALGWELQA
jgi:3-(3-hydroxy-phenyl)propionate hydroxylase